MAVLVTDGNQRASLAVVRALGRAGIPVVVGESQIQSLAGSSRFCQKSFRYPNPESDPGEFLESVRAELRDPAYQTIIPITDISLNLLTRNNLPNHVNLPFPGSEQIARAQDKGYVLSLARQLGVPCPLTYDPGESELLRELPKGFTFPVVVKPRSSRFLQDGHWTSERVRYATDCKQLLEIFEEIQRRGPTPLVQEKIEGDGRGVFLLIWDREVKAAFCHRRLREKPPSGGVSVYSESVPLDMNLVEQSLTLLRALEWQGVAMVEFKTDRRDGTLKLMEINGRFWGSLQLAIDAGVDFPLILFRLANGESVAPQLDYKIGVRTRWLLGDLDHLWISLTRPEAAARAGSRLLTCARFLNFFNFNTRQEIFRWEDPSPGWFELKQYWHHAFRRQKHSALASPSV